MMYTFPALISAATMSNMTVLDTAGQYDLDMSSEATYPISFQVKMTAFQINVIKHDEILKKITPQKDIYSINVSTMLGTCLLLRL